jgi:hypothetical protein
LRRPSVASWIGAIDPNNPNEVEGCSGAKGSRLVLWTRFSNS